MRPVDVYAPPRPPPSRASWSSPLKAMPLMYAFLQLTRASPGPRPSELLLEGAGCYPHLWRKHHQEKAPDKVASADEKEAPATSAGSLQNHLSQAQDAMASRAATWSTLSARATPLDLPPQAEPSRCHPRVRRGW